MSRCTGVCRRLPHLGDMFKSRDLWVPCGDRHLFSTLRRRCKRRKRPIVDGRVAWRYDRIKAALELLPRNRRRTCVDVGAHIGMWTRWLARDFKWTIAFEPIQRHFDCLQKNLISDYGNVELHRVALGNFHGSVRMKIDRKSSGRSHAAPDGEGWRYCGPTCPVDTLDQYEIPMVDLIKIDVEGWEKRVLEGAKETIMTWKPLVIIEQLGHEERYGEEPYAAMELLKSWGAVELRGHMKGDHYMGWAP